MTETKLLDKTLALIDETGTLKAYEYLKKQVDNSQVWSSQVYNFLYCLAATSDRSHEAVFWLKEAVITQEMWYRPEVFEDEDLDSIRGDDQFKRCVKISNERFKEASKNAITEFTWTEKTSDNLLLALHGNQQNNSMSKQFWNFLEGGNYQVEYLQSSELDSCGLYRWSDDCDGPKQIVKKLHEIEGLAYNCKILSGFSAGCNAILRSILQENIEVDKVILVSPWMPIVDVAISEIINKLKDATIDLVIICGLDDEDCLPHCKSFEEKASEIGFNYDKVYIENLGHEYPENFDKIIKKIL